MRSTWEALAEDARWAPSPHNTQPTRLRVIDRDRAELCFLPDRGLPVADPEGRFTYLTFGIVAETIRIAAHARGHELEIAYVDGPLYDGPPGELRKVADLRLVPQTRPVADLDPALIRRRRTNRRPYDSRPVPPHVLAELRAEAGRFGHAFNVSTDRRAIRWVKELNRDALYHDLQHDPYRKELATWLRYSEREAQHTGDGLSPDALGLPGWLLKGVMRHHRLFTAPGVNQLTQQLYLRTMAGISTVGWLQGDFVDAGDWTRAGHLMLRLWLILTEHGIDWQPYGSIVTNDAARSSMVAKFGMEEGPAGRDMVWLLVRMGYSRQKPAASKRLPLSEVVQ